MAEVEWLHSPERGGECGLTVQGDTRGKPLGPHGQEPKSRSRDQVRCAEPDGGAWNATIGARVLRRMSFSARFAASANYATTPPGAAICKGFLKVISPWFARRRACSVEGKTLATLRDTLLPKLIAGSIRANTTEPTA